MSDPIRVESAAVAATYTVVSNAFVSTDRVLAQIEIGDVKQPEFFPQIKIKKFGNEVNGSFRLVCDEPAEVSTDGAAIVWRTATLEARFYGLTDLEPNDAHEFEIRLFARQPTNVLTFTLQTKGLTFTKQPVFPNGPDAEGYLWRPNGRGGRQRHLPHVSGSYVAYGTNEGDYTALGGHHYRSGKALHIYRPWAEDATGTRVWCDLDVDVDAGLMTITVPADFLAAAVYPVLVDPTFGYSGTAATDDNIANAHAWVKAATTPASNGSLTSITVKGRKIAGAPTMEVALYADSAGAPAGVLASVDTGGSLWGASDAEVTTNLAYGSIVSGTQYWLAFRSDNGNGSSIDADFKIDVSGTSNFAFTTPLTGADWEASGSGASVVSNEKVYAFGTYTASAAPVTLTPSAGVLSLTGAALALVFAFALTPPVGALTWTGQAPTVVPNRILTPSAGALTWTGGAPGLTPQIGLSAGVLTYTGQAPAVLSSRILTPTAGSLPFTGAAPLALVDHPLALPAGVLTLAGQYVSVQFAGPTTGVLTWTGYALTIPQDVNRTLQAGSLPFTGAAPVLFKGPLLTPSAGVLDLTGAALTLLQDKTLTPSAGVLTWTGGAPQLSAVLTPSAGVLTWAGAAPTVQATELRVLSAGVLTWAGTVTTFGRGLALQAGTLPITGQAPTVVVLGGAFTVPILAGSLPLTGQAPILAFTITPTAGVVTWTSDALTTLDTGTRVVPGGVLTWASTALSVQTATALLPGALTWRGVAPTVATTETASRRAHGPALRYDPIVGPTLASLVAAVRRRLGDV